MEENPEVPRCRCCNRPLPAGDIPPDLSGPIPATEDPAVCKCCGQSTKQEDIID